LITPARGKVGQLPAVQGRHNTIICSGILTPFLI